MATRAVGRTATPNTPKPVAQDLVWERDGLDWPLREHSRFVEVAGLRWHVQQLGEAGRPAVLLIHGTGASTHSWRDVAPALARRYQVVSIDLPGHAFTGPAPVALQSLTGMASGLADLMRQLGVTPALIVGHSAGAAIGLRMALDGLLQPRAIVSFNGALLPLGGLIGPLFLPAAKLLALHPLVPRLFAWHARDHRVLHRLIGSTGSKLDTRGLALYGRLVGSPAHAAGALAMMANWDLRPLARDLPDLRVPLRLIVGEEDRTVLPSLALQVKALLPSATLTRMAALGHLAHEEAPDDAVRLVEEAADSVGV